MGAKAPSIKDGSGYVSQLHRLFQQEMRALQEEGKEFGADFPEAARFLDPGRFEDQDPYVERLIEASALLVSQIRSAAMDIGASLDHLALEQFAPCDCFRFWSSFSEMN